MTLKKYAKFKENLTCGFKRNIKNLVNFQPTTQNYENFFWIAYCCLKYARFEVKKYRKIIFRNTEEKRKIWRKTDSWSKKWQQKFGLFWYKQWEIWIFALYCATLIENIFCLSKKGADKLCVPILRNDAIFDEELTCALKNCMGSLANFTKYSKTLKYVLSELFCRRYIMFKLQNYRGVMCHDTEGLCIIFLKNLIVGLKNEIRNLA